MKINNFFLKKKVVNICIYLNIKKKYIFININSNNNNNKKRN